MRKELTDNTFCDKRQETLKRLFYESRWTIQGGVG